MKNSLFEFPPDKPFPEGISKTDLNDLQKTALSLCAFVDHRRSFTELKEVCSEIITSLPGYKTATKSSVKACIDYFADQGFFFEYRRGGIGLFLNIKQKLLPLAADHREMIDMAYKIEKLRGYRSSDELRLKLAILSCDINKLHAELSAHNYRYFAKEKTERLYGALLDLNDLSFIIPLLPDMDEFTRNKFLNKLPYYLSYRYMEQWEVILLSRGPGLYAEAIYNYLSCASLILPPRQVISISEKLDANPNSMFFSELLLGNPTKARMMASSWLTAVQEQEGHRRNELPGAFGLLYGIVLLLTGEMDSLKLAAIFVRKAKQKMPVFPEQNNPFMLFGEILLMLIDHRSGKKRVDWNAIYREYRSPLHQQFVAVVLSWLGKPLQNAAMPSYVSEKEEMEYRAAGLCIENEEEKAGETRLKELEEKLGSIPMAKLMKKEEPWEVLLSALASPVGRTKKYGTEKKSRLIWMVDPLNEYSLEVNEQAKNKSGWSKGQKRSLAGLLKKVPDFALPEDIRVINTLRKDPYYKSVSPRKWEDLLEALSAHPHVFTHTLPRLPLEIRMQDVQIQIDQKGEGLSVRLKPSSPEEPVVMETPTRYICTRWSSRALQVHAILREHGSDSISIPSEGMKKAGPVIENLGEVMPVTGSFAGASLKTKKSANIPVLQLTPVNEQLHVQLLIEVLKDEATMLVPGVGASEIVVETADRQKLNIRRDREREREMMDNLVKRINWLQELEDSSAQMFIDDDRDILDFLSEVKEKAPEVKVTWPEGERLRVARVVSHADLRVQIARKEDWFELDGEVLIDGKLKLTLQQLIEKSEGGMKKYVQLDDKTYLTLKNDLQKRLASLNAVSNKKGKQLEVHPLGASALQDLLEDVPDVKVDVSWEEHLEKLDRLKSYEPGVPGNLQAELRPYQTAGILWLDRLHEWGVGACLADDMGLGKTIQAIGILLKYAQNGPGLVIAPSSVCVNWENEIVRFAPTLKPQVLRNVNREATLDKLSGYDVLIVSYGLIQSNPDLLAKRKWNTVVLDEAHAIKNSKSVRARAVMKLKSRFRILTTGTPVQNHLGELWSLFQFMNPGMLGSQDQFLKKFGDGKSASGSASGNTQNRSALNRYIAPFILRRNKSEVLDDLPGKTEITLHVTLSEKERAMYEVLREKAIEHISATDISGGNRHMQILSEITKLRQMSCHPRLVAPDSKLSGSKLETLETLVDDLLSARHQALIFSQFTKHLEIIRQMLDKKGLKYQYLDGSTPVRKREEIIQDFQKGRSDLFLISLKAGGSGLNLTAADYVIHMDPWWNPAVEDQASDRAHRIGQTRPVTIYRLIAENTIEEKIVKMHHEKRDLADKLLAGTDQSAKISSEELFKLIAENH